MTTKKTFTLSGQILPGANLGVKTGARTANLDVALAKDLPRGLYSCTIQIQQKTYDGLLYYGYNSLRQKDCLEVHILNFSQDIYGEKIQITTKKFIRPEIKFKNIATLKKQIKNDITEAQK
jgi:riboflavin kinase/FMN adenylyltransferase